MFQFRLAKDLGKTVAQVRAEITPWEFVMWGEFYQRERKAIEDLHGSR